MFYVGSRAVITHWLWSRYPKQFARFMDCAACAGFWYGILVASTLDLRPIHPTRWINTILVGLAMTVLTPVVAGIMQAGLERLGSAVDDADG